MKRKILSFILVFSFIFSALCMSSYAASVPVTEKNLKEALQSFFVLNGEGSDYKITVDNHMITVKWNEGEETFQYDLTNQPQFLQTVEVKKGMSYEAFNRETENLSAPMLGYMAVANIEGVDFEDASLYFMMYMLTTSLSGLSSDNTYMIIDDTDLSEGVTVKKDANDTGIIYVSEFENRVIDYAKNVYGNSVSFNDADSLNSFAWTQELKDVTDTSCKIVTTLTVNPDADFSQLQSLSKKMSEEFANSFFASDDEEQTVSVQLTDIEDTKYEFAVETLVDMGVINGFEDQTFRPSENVTRAQFAKMLVEALQLEQSSEPVVLRFSDVTETHWAKDYIKIAVDNGIINGYPDGTFGPENSVTFAEAMAMILRALKLEDAMSDKSWPLGYMNEAQNVGLLDSVDYQEPNLPANRGETAISLYNMIHLAAEIERKNSLLWSATYTNEKGTITLEEYEKGRLEFSFSGLANGEMWSLGTTLDYADGVASTENDFFDEVVKIHIVVENDIITVKASSTDRESGYNGINGVYQLETN